MSERDNLNVIMAERLSSIHSDMGDLKDTVKESLKDISSAMNKLVQIEERVAHTNQNYERLVRENEKVVDTLIKMDRRIDTIEKDMPMQKQVTKWFLTAVWSAAAAAVYFVGKMTGIV